MKEGKSEEGFPCPVPTQNARRPPTPPLSDTPRALSSLSEKLCAGGLDDESLGARLALAAAAGEIAAGLVAADADEREHVAAQRAKLSEGDNRDKDDAPGKKGGDDGGGARAKKGIKFSAAAIKARAAAAGVGGGARAELGAGAGGAGGSGALFGADGGATLRSVVRFFGELFCRPGATRALRSGVSHALVSLLRHHGAPARGADNLEPRALLAELLALLAPCSANAGDGAAGPGAGAGGAASPVAGSSGSISNSASRRALRSRSGMSPRSSSVARSLNAASPPRILATSSGTPAHTSSYSARYAAASRASGAAPGHASHLSNSRLISAASFCSLLCRQPMRASRPSRPGPRL